MMGEVTWQCKFCGKTWSQNELRTRAYFHKCIREPIAPDMDAASIQILRTNSFRRFDNSLERPNESLALESNPNSIADSYDIIEEEQPKRRLRKDIFQDKHYWCQSCGGIWKYNATGKRQIYSHVCEGALLRPYPVTKRVWALRKLHYIRVVRGGAGETSHGYDGGGLEGGVVPRPSAKRWVQHYGRRNVRIGSKSR